MALIIALAHQKGGVGKTTLALNLYDVFTENGQNCLIVDADAQGSIKQLYDTLGGNESWGELNLVTRADISSFPDLLNHEADVILIDTPPYHSSFLPEVFSIADLVLVPCKPSPLDVLAITETFEFIKSAQEQRPQLKAAAVLNMVINGTDFPSQIRALLESRGYPILRTEIANRVAYSRALFLSRSITSEHNKKALEEMDNLASELVEFLNS